MMGSKRFDGVLYQRTTGVYKTKKLSEESAQWFRDDGCRARINKDSSVRGRWYVFIKCPPAGKKPTKPKEKTERKK